MSMQELMMSADASGDGYFSSRYSLNSALPGSTSRRRKSALIYTTALKGSLRQCSRLATLEASQESLILILSNREEVILCLKLTIL